MLSKKSIIVRYLNDLNNLVPQSPARDQRIAILEEELEQMNSSDDIQNVGGCFSVGFIEDKGCCDGDCDAVEWIGDTCKYKNECKLGCGTVWIKPNNR